MAMLPMYAPFNSPYIHLPDYLLPSLFLTSPFFITVDISSDKQLHGFPILLMARL
jgi:hypothetical protein